jgi:hypothetical protein
MSDYLFDKSGAADADVERLERLLAPMAYRPRALPSLPSLSSPIVRNPRRRMWMAAATLAAAALLALLVTRPWRPRAPNAPPQVAQRSWPATVNGDGATLDGHPIAGAARVPVGAWLDSGGARVTLAVPGVGRVELSPHTRVSIATMAASANGATTGATANGATTSAGAAANGATTANAGAAASGADDGGLDELRLAHGALVADVTAPPRHFAVATPSLRAVDLGCAFSLAVDDAGAGTLSVTAGAVALVENAREVVVPAGASCAFSSRGAAALVMTDAELALRTALSRFAAEPDTLRTLLATARPQDRALLRRLAAGAGSDARALVQSRLGELAAAVTQPPQQQQRHRAPKPHPHATHAPHAATPPAQKSPATQKSPPPSQPKPTRLDHDALKGLERSIQ